ncbi:hypothetical protein SAMN06295920_10459 [Rhizorhabdus histidinilytica]|uniref:Lipoprotein n=1 Tax=Rhizorhabdus histidinilytica TaxID=439228 RepID=A0A1T5CGZ2_9SPHN|nr:hypothetical protein SAMN06295920_10459 [Rhizorhabdus histidinilytica]
MDRKGGVILAMFALCGCDLLSPQWKGWVYPNGAELTVDIPIGLFSTLEECRASAKRTLQFTASRDENGNAIEGDYECGYKCKAASDLGGLNVCEKTEH